MDGGAKERNLRARLGIPPGARRVLIFTESSHWDPNWFLTSEQYFRWFVARNLDEALDELAREPGRVYSIECVFFLRMYWERRPERREEVRRLVNEGRLRLTSSGVTTADTLIPGTEAILRDFLLGQEWMRRQGMTQEPRVAYFPDSFGHSPALPSILKAAGFQMAVVTRIDGMFFPGSDYELGGRFPRPGSSAETLLKALRSLDFVWRAPDGAEVLSHWNAFTYGFGDLLAHRGIVRVYNLSFAIPSRGEAPVARRIERYAAQLEPVSRTPYMLCPIGFDFNRPIRGLGGLLDRYNRARYPETGIWTAVAGLDDYLDLVDCHRAGLPVVDLDPNPYWTGFYSSRPSLKKMAGDAVDLLLLAERTNLVPGACPDPPDLGEAWWRAVSSNHHDFITGTATDRVVRSEQEPWLASAAADAEAAIKHAAVCVQTGPRRRRAERPRWRDRGDSIEVATPHYVVELSRASGGCIVAARHAETGAVLLAGPSNDLVSYRDSGGLWRMGHEYAGGYLLEKIRSSMRPARMDLLETDDGIEVRCECEIDGEQMVRSAFFRTDSTVVRFRAEGRAARGRTVAVRFVTGIEARRLVMDAPGGVVSRPSSRQYDPTFWPIQHFVQIVEGRADGGSHPRGRFAALFTAGPAAVACRQGGSLELIAFRNAVHERVLDVLPIPGMPVAGYDAAIHTIRYAISFTPEGDRRRRGNPLTGRRASDDPHEEPGRTALKDLVTALASTDRPDVEVTALKRASRGKGLIARLVTHAQVGGNVILTLGGRAARTASLCDARERDIAPLEVRDGSVHLEMPGNIATVRIVE